MLTAHINNVLGQLLNHSTIESKSTQELIDCIDLTLLDIEASSKHLASLKEKANLHRVAAICVYPSHLTEFSASDYPKLATVINFPQGNNTLEQSMSELDKAINNGAQEIDYVFHYQAWITGATNAALQQCHYVMERCKKQSLTTKVILETGAYATIDQIYEVSKEVILSGCDFIKTSTGKIPQGATLSAACAMLSAIKDTQSNCGLKVSGGIKSPQQATAYAHLAELMLGKPIEKSWFRIGASSLLDELLSSNH